jgi:tetratricopeptide (TPR) repeat protein
VIHRDLKPANLLVSSEGLVKICDFGIAKTTHSTEATATNVLLGTPAYMSPEQALGSPCDARSDLYSAGVVAYELITGTNPHNGPTPGVTIARILNGTPFPPIFEVEPSIPAAAEEVIERLLEPDPDKRHQHASEALDELGPLLEDLRRRFPGLLPEMVRDPKGTAVKVNRTLAASALELAQQLLKKGPAEQKQAILQLYSAVMLDPENAQASRLFEELRRHEQVHFGAAKNPKVRELEEQLEQQPDSPQILQQLGQLHRMEGNLLRAVSCYKRYLKLRPSDGYALTQLTILTGDRTLIHKTGREGPSTKELVDGIKTGGLAARAEPLPRRPAAGLKQPVMPVIKKAPDAPAGPLKKILFAGVVIGAGWLAVHQTGRFIQKSTSQVAEGTDTLTRARAAAEHAEDQAQATKELEAATGARQRDGADRLEAAIGDYRHGDYAKAAKSIDDILQRHPKLAEMSKALLYLGKAQLALHEDHEAGEAFDRILSEYAGSSEYEEALLRRAQVFMNRRDPLDAIERLDKLISERANSPFALEAQVTRAEAHLLEEKREDAAADFKAALSRLGPSDPLYPRAKQGLESITAAR